jgi:hypothetical protein
MKRPLRMSSLERPASGRFSVEFWRINPAVGFGLSEAQWFSLALAAIGEESVGGIWGL